jgi:5-methylcytosine-specific restriction endonuclease McrA
MPATPAPADYWRAIILYGLNTATYKPALGQTLLSFAQQGKTTVTMPELAEAFFDLYHARLQTGKPQLAQPNRLTVMERIVAAHNAGRLTRAAAIDRVAREAFGDVLPRFHSVNNRPLSLRFYEQTATGLVLTDAVGALATAPPTAQAALRDELTARWDLLEGAFEIRRDNFALANDIRRIYLTAGYARRDLTATRPVLHAYQDGRCFYCGEPLGPEPVHVDHVIARQLLQHDDLWNLVLAHDVCNELKSDALPALHYIAKLVARNERFISSNHPIKDKLIAQLGPTPDARRRFTLRVYDDARRVLPLWPGLPGYNPATDATADAVFRAIVLNQ